MSPPAQFRNALNIWLDSQENLANSEKETALVAVAGCEESLKLLQLSDHRLVSIPFMASWNVLEMHYHAWMHYATALTHPSKQDALLLKQFLPVAVVLPAAVAVHDRAVLTEVNRVMCQVTRFVALQEVSE